MDTTRCKRCRQPTISTRCSLGWDVRVDVDGLDTIGELQALHDGRRTYTRHGSSSELHPRNPRTILGEPAGTIPRQTVHRDHACTGKGTA